MRKINWRWAKIVILGMMFTLIIMSSGLTVEAKSGKWEHNANGWWYSYADGTYAIGWDNIGGEWYYFNDTGYMVTGWKMIDEKLYYFNTSGSMVTGKKIIGGVEYTFGSNGVLIADGNYNELTYDENYHYEDHLIPSKGTAKVAVFLVDFSDRKHTDNESRMIRDSLEVSIHDYYKQESYNALNMEVCIVGDWYMSIHERDYYTFLSNEKGYLYAQEVLLEETIKNFDDTVDFSQFDSNHDGYIDEIVLMCTGYLGKWGEFWWPCANGCQYIVEADEVRAGCFAWIPLDAGATTTVLHEIGHGLGLPDLYDNFGEEPFTVSDMMRDVKGHFNAYSKIKLGWIDPIIISDNTNLTLMPSEGKPCAAIVYPKGDKKSEQFFVLEFINHVDHGGSVRLPNGGLRIWRVNLNGSNNHHGTTPYIENVDWQDNRWGSIFYDQGQDFHGVIWTEDMEFTPYKYPSSYFYKGSVVSDGFTFTGISITNITTDGKKLSCNVSYEDKPSQNTFTYSCDYKIGNKIYGTVIFPVEVYINKIDISLKSEDGTEIPITYYIDDKIENHAYTHFVFEADISDLSSRIYRLVIKAGSLINTFGIPNDEIKIEMIDVNGGGSHSTNRSLNTYGVSEIVKVNNELYTFQVLNEMVTLLHVDKYYNTLESKPLFKIKAENTLRAYAYDAQRIVLQVFVDNVLYVYTVKPEGTYEPITSISTYLYPQSNFVDNKLFAFKVNKSGRYDACLIDIDKKTVTSFLSDLSLESCNIEMSNKHIYAWKNEEGKNFLSLYDSSGNELTQKEFTEICVLERTEHIYSMFEYDGNAAFVSLVKDEDNITSIYVTVVNDNMDVLKRKCVYKDYDSTVPGKMYKTNDGFVLGLETTTTPVDTGFLTGFGNAVFFNENLDYLFEKILDKEYNFDYIDGVIQLDENEYIIYSPFESMYFSIEKKDIKVCNHDYSKEKTIKNATKSEDGIKTFICTRCGDSYIEGIPNLSKYSEEWISGKWYNKDGTQTYKYKLAWKVNKNRWWVQDTSGWYPKNMWQKIDGKWYYFKTNGYMASNEWYKGYWFNKNGTWTYKARASWKKYTNGWSYGDTKGWYAKNQWQKIDDVTYYFKNDGFMASKEWVKGYYFNKDGSWTYTYKGTWRKTNNKWWFGDTSGWYARNCTYVIDGKVYTFDKNGYLKE